VIKLSIKKEDVYRLIDELDEYETQRAYDFLKRLISSKNKKQQKLIEADNSPLDDNERRDLEEILKEDSVDWEDVKRELDL
jgi:predicted transcriptional regulator